MTKTGVDIMPRTDAQLLDYYKNEQANIQNGSYDVGQGYKDLINSKVTEYTNKLNPASTITSQPIQQQPIKQTQPTQPAQQPVQTQPAQQPTQTQPAQQQVQYQSQIKPPDQQSNQANQVPISYDMTVPLYAPNEQYNAQPVYQEIANTKPFTSQYTDQINKLVQNAQQPFTYNPNSDAFLQQAQQQAMNAVTTEMNRRGIANSDQSRFEAYKQASSLVPQYEAMAYQRYNDNITNQLKTAEFLQQVNMNDYQIYKDSISNLYNRADLLDKLSTQELNQYKMNMQTMFDAAAANLNERKQALAEKEQEIKYAQDKLENQGYVDNEIAPILGMKVNSPSRFALQLSQKLLSDIQIEKAKTENQITQDNNKFQNDLKELDYKQQMIEAERKKQAATVGTAFQYMANLTPEAAIETWKQLGPDMIEAIGQDAYVNVMQMLQKMKEAKDDSEYKNQQLSIQELNAKINAGQLQVAQQNADTSAYNAQTSRMNAETSRQNADTAASNKVSGFEKYIDDNFKISESQKVFDNTGEKTVSKSSYDKDAIGAYLGTLSNMTDVNGNPVISPETLSKIGSKYGLKMLLDDSADAWR